MPPDPRGRDLASDGKIPVTDSRVFSDPGLRAGGRGCSVGDGDGDSGGVELGDQREDQPGDEAEEPLVITEEYPNSFGDRDDEP